MRAWLLLVLLLCSGGAVAGQTFVVECPAGDGDCTYSTEEYVAPGEPTVLPDGDPNTTLPPPGSTTGVGSIEVCDQASGVCVAGKVKSTADPLETPAGWSGPTSPPSSSTPQQYAASWSRAACPGPYTSFTNAAACSNSGFTCATATTSCTVQCSGIGGDGFSKTGCQIYWTNGSPTGSTFTITANLAYTCSAGYTHAGGSPGTCPLTDPTAVPRPPNSVCVAPTAGGYGTDPDCTILSSGGDSGDTEFSTDGSGFSATGEDGTVVDWAPGGGGGGRLTVGRPNDNGGTTEEIVDFDANGNVTGASRRDYLGTGSAANSGTAAVGTGSCGGVGQVPCQIDETGTPTSATGVAGKADELEGKEPSDFGVGEYTGSTPSSWSVFPELSGSDTCTNPFSYAVLGHSITFDLCSVWLPAKGILAWFLYAFTAVYIWRRVSSSLGVGGV